MATHPRPRIRRHYSNLNQHLKYGNTPNASQRPTERKHGQTRGRRRFVLLISSNPLGLHPEAMFIFRLFPAHQQQKHTLNVCDNWITGCAPYNLHKCIQARLAPQRRRCHTFRAHTHTHTHPSFHSCKYTLLTHFLKETKKHWITAGQWAKAGHHGNKLRGTGAGCVYVGWEGSWCLRC